MKRRAKVWLVAFAVLGGLVMALVFIAQRETHEPLGANLKLLAGLKPSYQTTFVVTDQKTKPEAFLREEYIVPLPFEKTKKALLQEIGADVNMSFVGSDSASYHFVGSSSFPRASFGLQKQKAGGTLLSISKRADPSLFDRFCSWIRHLTGHREEPY